MSLCFKVILTLHIDPLSCLSEQSCVMNSATLVVFIPLLPSRNYEEAGDHLPNPVYGLPVVSTDHLIESRKLYWHNHVTFDNQD